MKKLLIISFASILGLCLFANDANRLLLMNYNKAYIVDITVDTSLSLHDIYPKNKSKKAMIPSKIHCDFKIIYQWENDFLYRMVVKKSYKIAKEKITQYNTNFPFCIYLPDANDSCSCNYYDDSYFFGIVSHNALYMPSKLGLLKVGFTEKDSVTLYTLYDLQILRCSYINKTDRFYYNFHCININDKSYINYYKSKTTEDRIKDHIYKSIFYESKEKKGFYSCFLFPDSLPVEYGKAKTFSYNKSGDGNCIVSSNKVYNISGKAMYRITNNNTFNHPTDENKKVNVKYDFLYIPHVMYMPLGSFKYKIKSINGKPLKEFMAGYVDDFKPTLLQSTGTEHYSKIYEIADVQVPPTFPGGQDSLFSYQSRNISYPSSAREAGVEGKVIIGYVVNKDGTISDVQVLRSLDPACDEAAVKLVKNMPKWIPSKQGDKPVRVRMTMPIVFKQSN